MITEEQVISAQQQWANGVVKIGSLKEDRTMCESFTSDFLNNLYAFDLGKISFKPTKCSIEQFRESKEKAISYFIAGEDRVCKEDKGFAIQPWASVKFDNANIILEENRALATGNYFFTDTEGNEAKVEYTFGYKLVNGNLKIDLHHSSFPYNPES